MRIERVARRAAVLGGLVWLAACGEVSNTPVDAAQLADAPAADAGDDASTSGEDAGPDAAVIGCATDDDCATPPDDCHQPGSCNADNQCEFPAVDCSAMDSECSAGVCVAGACQPEPIAEGELCGAETTCDDFGACSFDPTDICDETGQRSRTCQDFTCAAGACVGGAPYDDTEACTRDQDGVTCQATTQSCSGCAFSPLNPCAEVGSRICTTRDYECQDAACTEIESMSTQTCTRDTDGDTCGTQMCPGGFEIPVCCGNGSCDVECGGGCP